jgi:hypothetical protein
MSTDTEHAELLPREIDDLGKLASEIGRCWISIERGLKDAAKVQARIDRHKAGLNELLGDLRSQLLQEGRHA